MDRAVLLRHPRLRGSAGLCYGRRELDLLDPEADIPPIVAALLAWRGAAILTSPSRRCRIVAERLGAGLGSQVRTDARLLELDFGAWEGLAWDAVPRLALDRWAADPLGFAPPGGESGAALVARVTAFARDSLMGDATCIVVTHAGPLKILHAVLREQPVDLFAASVPMGSWTVVPAGTRKEGLLF